MEGFLYMTECEHDMYMINIVRSRGHSGTAIAYCSKCPHEMECSIRRDKLGWYIVATANEVKNGLIDDCFMVDRKELE